MRFIKARTLVRKFRRGDEGSELIEFALVSILFFMLMFGIVEFGRAIWIYDNVAHLAREGARYAVVRGKESGLSATAKADIATHVQTRGAGMTDLAVLVTYEDEIERVSGTWVQVRVSRPFTTAAPLLPIGAITLASTSRMVISF